jgi:hypothetical protein
MITPLGPGGEKIEHTCTTMSQQHEQCRSLLIVKLALTNAALLGPATDMLMTADAILFRCLWSLILWVTNSAATQLVSGVAAVRARIRGRL